MADIFPGEARLQYVSWLQGFVEHNPTIVLDRCSSPIWTFLIELLISISTAGSSKSTGAIIFYENRT